MKQENGTAQINRFVDELNELGLPAMAASLDSIYHSGHFLETDHLTLLSEIVGAEYQVHMSKKWNNRLKRARLSGCPAQIDKCIDSKERAYLPQDITDFLASLDFIRDGMNVCILGPSDSGKTYLAKAIGIAACQEFRVAYLHCESFLEEMVSLKLSDYAKFQKKMRSFLKMDLLILDDFLLHTITDEREIKVLHELLEKRSELSKSVIVCSQRDPKSWTSMILNDEVASNALYKRATKHYTVVINSKAGD